MSESVVVIGATGLIGSQLLNLLLNDKNIGEVRILVRKWKKMEHAKLKVFEIDFDNKEALSHAMGKGNAVFCCIGTTKSNVNGNIELYRKIDIGIPTSTASIAIEKGFKKYLLVSAVGANSKASNYYLKIKGEVENNIMAMPFESTHIFRPSFLLGNRKENRPIEKIMNPIMKIISPLFIGSWKKYRSIESSAVAKSMLAAYHSSFEGNHIYHYSEMIKLIS